MSSDKGTKERFSKCGVCKSLVNMNELYSLLNKKMCRSCGEKEIRRWNELVAEAESKEAL